MIRFLLILTLLVPSISFATDWSYYIDITTVSSKIDGDQSNFKMVIYENDGVNNQLDDALWGHVRSDGLDIVFTATTETQYSTGDPRYNREVVFIEVSNKELEVWVDMPTILAASGVTVRMWYGGDSISNDTDTWTDYVTVQHLFDAGSGTTSDSTSNGHNGTAINQATEDTNGILDKCFTFDGTSDAIDFSDIAEVTGISSFTISAWFKTGTNGNGSIFTKFDTGTNGSWYIATISNAIRFATVNSSSNRVNCDFSVSDYNDDEWHYVVGVYDGSNMTVYYDSQPCTPISQTGNIKDTIYDVRIGMFRLSSTFDFDGEIDEVRFLADTVDDDWIDTEYENQVLPSSFYTSGSEQTPGVVVNSQVIMVN